MTDVKSEKFEEVKGYARECLKDLIGLDITVENLLTLAEAQADIEIMLDADSTSRKCWEVLSVVDIHIADQARILSNSNFIKRELINEAVRSYKRVYKNLCLQ